jgi:hypothetical protein
LVVALAVWEETVVLAIQHYSVVFNPFNLFLKLLIQLRQISGIEHGTRSCLHEHPEADQRPDFVRE